MCLRGLQDIELDDVQTVFPTADRVVAIGDVHGDFDALSGCLKVSFEGYWGTPDTLL